MDDLFLLSLRQMAMISPFFPLAHGVPRVDDRRVVSGIVYVIKNGLQWKDAPKGYGPYKTLYNRFIRWSRLGVFDRIFAALASHVNLKQVTVVDDDIDIYDPKDVEWAVATRVQGDEDIVIIPGALGHVLDKSTKEGVSAKVGIDATIPLDRKKDFVRVKYWNLDKIDLKDYLS